MASPHVELVGLALKRLRESGAVAALAGDRIWHRAPEGAGFPRIAGFDTSGLRADMSCLDSSEITLSVHLWTRDGIDPLQDARALAWAVAEALHDFPLALPTNRLAALDHRGERIFYDADGLTGHGVVEFVAVTET